MEIQKPKIDKNAELDAVSVKSISDGIITGKMDYSTFANRIKNNEEITLSVLKTDNPMDGLLYCGDKLSKDEKFIVNYINKMPDFEDGIQHYIEDSYESEITEKSVSFFEIPNKNNAIFGVLDEDDGISLFFDRKTATDKFIEKQNDIVSEETDGMF